MTQHANDRLASAAVKRLVPGLGPAIVAIGEEATAAGIEPALVELMYLRASQINGCAYCVQWHIAKGRELGIPDAKLNLVVAWDEAGIFTEREEAALAWTEVLTLIADTRVPDSAWEAVRSVFSEQEVAGLTAAVIAINAWNRIAVTFRYAPPV